MPSRRLAHGACAVGVLLLAAALALVQGQTLIGSSVTRDCLSVSYGPVNLDCVDEREVTVLLMDVSPDSSGTSKFVVNLRSLPPPGMTQTGGANFCDLKDENGQCIVSTPAEITVEVINTALQWTMQLEDLLVPYTYHTFFNRDTNNKLDFNSACYLLGVYPSTAPGSPISIYNTTDLFLDEYSANLVKQYFGCPFVGDDNAKKYNMAHSKSVPNFNSELGESNSQLNYVYSCGNDKKITAVVQFQAIGPIGRVYTTRGVPNTVAQLKVSVKNLDTGIVNEVFMDTTVNPNAAVGTDGTVMVQLADITSPSFNFGPSIYGKWIVANTSTSGDTQARFTMVQPGMSRMINPWPNTADFSYVWPSSEMLSKLLGRNVGNSPQVSEYALMYVNESFTNGMCRDCGCYGVTPSIYQTNPSQVYVNGFSQLFGFREGYFFQNGIIVSDNVKHTPRVSFADLSNILNYCTCIPTAGVCSPAGENTPTLCKANQAFDYYNYGDVNTRKARYVSSLNVGVPFEHMPRSYVPGYQDASGQYFGPNMWFDEPYLMSDIKVSRNFRLQISMVGSLVGVKTTVTPGAIDTQKTTCTLSNNATIPSALGIVVCNNAPVFTATYTVYVGCTPSNKVEPVPPSTFHITDPLQPGHCAYVTQELSILVPVILESDGVQCVVQLGPESPLTNTKPDLSLIFATTTVSCTSVINTPLPKPVPNVTTRFNGSYVLDYPPGDEVTDFTTILTWIVIAIALLAAAGAVIYGIVQLVMFTKFTKKPST